MVNFEAEVKTYQIVFEKTMVISANVFKALLRNFYSFCGNSIIKTNIMK